MRVSDTNFYGTYPPKGYRIPGADVNGFKPGHTDKNYVYFEFLPL